ncbi:MAG: Gfo/Idh/MocA family oxidoreductase, partial [Desulfofustis sp.]|nr:Gfo/Idh/MocA family oxidoreductase [Desulfofustis sp.]
MNFYAMLQKRAAENNPIRVGVIGAGKFSSMFLSQARLTPGMQIVGIADLDPGKALQALVKTGWDSSQIATADSSGAISDAARRGRIALTDDAAALIDADCQIIMEITGNPEAGTTHALRAIKSGKHVVMVNVEADCLLGPELARLARQQGVVYSMAYGDQPALIAEQLDWARTVGFEVVCAGKGT